MIHPLLIKLKVKRYFLFEWDLTNNSWLMKLEVGS